MTVIDPTGPKKPRGKPWPKGVSGNPKGRLHGARPVIAVALDALGQGRVEAIVAAMCDRAERGDVAAANVVLSRVWPPRRGRPVPLKLPEGAGADDLVAAAGAVVAAVADGTLTPEEAESVARVLETQRRSIETLDIERRLSALEASGA